jgi:hypothetical protein
MGRSETIETHILNQLDGTSAVSSFLPRSRASPKDSAEHRKRLTMLLDLLVEQNFCRVQLLEDLVKGSELLLGLGLLLLEELSVMS